MEEFNLWTNETGSLIIDQWKKRRAAVVVSCSIFKKCEIISWDIRRYFTTPLLIPSTCKLNRNEFSVFGFRFIYESVRFLFGSVNGRPLTGMLLIFSTRVKRKLNKGESELQKPQLFLFGTPCLEFILTKFFEQINHIAKLVFGHRLFWNLFSALVMLFLEPNLTRCIASKHYEGTEV